MKLFRKVLIANRGEIASRIIRTCRRLGISTVAVYSDADARSLHVRTADEAVHLGASSADKSYLDIEKILSAAKRTGADAIHPGYGFLSENADFAEACEQTGIVFIGPSARSIRAMGSKAAAKTLMERAGVPLTPGYHGENQDPDFLFTQANAIGYPLLVKASGGGGGKGMRRVDQPSDFLAALQSCKREARAAFGDDRVLLERYILHPRHIEVQVFGDKLGNILSLFERDCSVQRRYQKVVEEAPAPGMTEARRSAMSKAARDAAQAVGYVGAGTVEFIADQGGSFFFMEMNTRLQVEHPVTEMITGLDLVEWQLKVAAGERLPLTQEELSMRGHAIEARIYAEDPGNQFLPSTGRLVHLKPPESSGHMRIDTGVVQGDEITSFYDPMIGKLIVWDETRDAAIDRMTAALSAFQVIGVSTNLEFLKRLMETSSFRNADLDTGLIDRESQSLFSKPAAATAGDCVLAALALVSGETGTAARDPWAIRDGWRLNGWLRRKLQFVQGDTTWNLEIEYAGSAFRVRIGGRDLEATGSVDGNGQLVATIDGIRVRAEAVYVSDGVHIFHQGQHFFFKLLDPLLSKADDSSQENSLLSPMPGLLTMLLVEPGSIVEKGTPLLILEAMKMEYTIKAPAAGKVDSFLFSAGDQVPEGTQLLRFTPLNHGR